VKIRLTILPLAAAAALALSACGDDEKPTAEEHQSTPAVAIEEAGKTSAALTAALTTYKSGDKAAAEEAVSEAYLQHFELVEAPLDKVDHELNEDLEHRIREELVEKIKAGAPATEVEAFVTQIKADLVTAQAKLK
jgi:hypothetical protein